VGGGKDAYLIFTDRNGILQRAIRWGVSDSTNGLTALNEVGGESSIFGVGHYQTDLYFKSDTLPGNIGNKNGYLARWDTSGTLQWA
jgi:hypothetical protein